MSEQSDIIELFMLLLGTALKIAVFNAVPSSNINIKDIIGNYKCSSLAMSLFNASGLLSWW